MTWRFMALADDGPERQGPDTPENERARREGRWVACPIYPHPTAVSAAIWALSSR